MQIHWSLSNRLNVVAIIRNCHYFIHTFIRVSENSKYKPNLIKGFYACMLVMLQPFRFSNQTYNLKYLNRIRWKIIQFSVKPNFWTKELHKSKNLINIIVQCVLCSVYTVIFLNNLKICYVFRYCLTIKQISMVTCWKNIMQII